MTPTVLIVDDDALIRAVMRDLLTEQGLQVLQAKSGREALSVLKQQKVDLLIMDGLLPDASGPEWLAAHEPLLGGIPRILLSAFWKGLPAQTEAREKVRIDAFVSKPMKPAPFLTLLRSLLGLDPEQADASSSRSPPLAAQAA